MFVWLNDRRRLHSLQCFRSPAVRLRTIGHTNPQRARKQRHSVRAPMHLLGIDIGSSSIKGAVLDLTTLEPRYIVREPFPQPIAGQPPGHFEIEPLAVVQAFETVLQQLCASESKEDCEGLMLCGQHAGVVLANRSGEPQSNYLSWRDQRVLAPHPRGDGSYFDHLARLLTDSDRRRMGNELRPGSATSLLYWLAEREELPAGKTIPLSLAGFVVLHLAGGEPGMETTEGVGTLDVAARAWPQEVFARLGIDPLVWPVLRDYRVPAGTIEILGQRIPCFTPVGDQQCALAGALLGPGELSINVSTGSQVSQLAATCESGNYQNRCYFDGQFLNTITHLPAGRSLEVLVDLLGEWATAQGQRPADPWPYIMQAAASASDTDLAVDLSFFAGTMGNRGSVTNIAVDNLSVGSLFRAAFRNMADNYAVCAGRLAPQRDWRQIVFSGGLALKHDLLRRMIGKRLVGPQRSCSSEEDTLQGLLLLGLVATGRASSLAEATLQQTQHLQTSAIGRQ